MSKRSETVAAEECIALGASQRQLESYPNREVNLGALTVGRALPIRDRRLVGPWCFLDRFGPLTFSEALRPTRTSGSRPSPGFMKVRSCTTTVWAADRYCARAE